MKKTTVLQFLFVLAVGAFLLAPSAYATAGLRLFDGATCASSSNCVEVLSTGVITTIGGGVVNTASVTPAGKIAVDATVGVWDINVTTGLTKPKLGSAMEPEMDLNSTDTSTGAGTLTIQWSDTDFLYFPGYLSALAGGTTNKQSTTNSVTFSTYVDQSNTLFTPGVAAATSQTWPPYPSACTASGCPLTGSAEGGDITAPNYSLMEQLVFNVSGATQISGDFHLTVVPEPASVLLLGGVLLAAVKAIRRTRHA